MVNELHAADIQAQKAIADAIAAGIKTMSADFFWRTATKSGGRECEFSYIVPVGATVQQMLAGTYAAGCNAHLDLRHGSHGVYEIQTDLGIYDAPALKAADVRSPRATFKTWAELEAEELAGRARQPQA